MSDDLIPILISNYSFDFTTVRVVDDLLYPTMFSVRIEMMVNPNSTPDEIDLSLVKCSYWIDLVSKSVIACVGNKASVDVLIDTETHAPRIGNTIMLLPEEPDEEAIAKIIQSKFNALANDHILFSMIEIKADSSHGVGFTYLGDALAELPGMADWVGGDRNWFTKPWWDRDDASMLDTIPPEDVDLTKLPSWAYSLDFLGEKPAKPESVVLGFKPKVIKGGSSDKPE